MRFMIKNFLCAYFIASLSVYGVTNDYFLCENLEKSYDYCLSSLDFGAFYNNNTNLSPVCLKANLSSEHCWDRTLEDKKNCILPCDPKSKKIKKGFDSVSGMENIKNIITSQVIKILNNKEKAKKLGLRIPNGILLYGPPGCGKTFIASKIAEELNFDFIEVKESTIGGIHIHETSLNIRKVFKEAEKRAPVVVFLDEMSALLPERRNLAAHERYRENEVSELLMEIESASKRNILVIGATNFPDRLDHAAIRSGRMDKIIFIPPPDLLGRQNIFKLLLNDVSNNLSENEIIKLAKKTENYTTSDLVLVINNSAQFVLDNDLETVSFEIMENILNKTRPSLTKKEIENYRNLINIEIR